MLTLANVEVRALNFCLSSRTPRCEYIDISRYVNLTKSEFWVRIGVFCFWRDGLGVSAAASSLIFGILRVIA